MELNLKKIAEEVTSISNISEIYEGRDKGTMDGLLQYYEGEISINDMDIAGFSDKQYYIFTVTQNDEYYYYATSILSKIFDAWIKEAEGDVSAVRYELQKNPIDILITKRFSKAGNEYFAVKVQ